jgi:hypothetical protein
MSFYPVRPPLHASVPAPKGAQGEWGLRVAWGRARRRGPEFEQTGDATIFVVAKFQSVRWQWPFVRRLRLNRLLRQVY